MLKIDKQLRLKIETPIIVFLYRVFARWVGGYNFLLLTTTGRKSKRKRTVMLVYRPVEHDFVVVAANLGSDLHPGWFLNLKHNPLVQIQTGNTRINVLAEEADAEEREHLWENWIQENPGYQMFQERTSRKLPVVILKPQPHS